jgi:hypothetical protein
MDRDNRHGRSIAPGRPSGNGRHDLSDRSLADLATAKVAFLAVCRRCRHRGLLYPAALAAKLGPVTSARDVPRRLKCSECGAKGGTVRVTEVER